MGRFLMRQYKLLEEAPTTERPPASIRPSTQHSLLGRSRQAWISEEFPVMLFRLTHCSYHIQFWSGPEGLDLQAPNSRSTSWHGFTTTILSPSAIRRWSA